MYCSLLHNRIKIFYLFLRKPIGKLLNKPTTIPSHYSRTCRCHFVSNILLFQKILEFVRYMEKYVRVHVHVHCLLGNQGYRHALIICNTYCFPTTTMVTRTRHNATLHYTACLVSCDVYVWSPSPSPVTSSASIDPFRPRLFVSPQVFQVVFVHLVHNSALFCVDNISICNRHEIWTCSDYWYAGLEFCICASLWKFIHVIFIV